jgi:hypothetical protein
VVQTNIHTFFCFSLISDSAFGQEIPAKTDSTKIYKNIESISGKSKFTKFMYGLIFIPTPKSIPKRKGKKKTFNNLVQKPYSAFEGKIIRHIIIETLDPFGYSITDTTVKAQNFLAKSGNYLHIKSREITIRNLLLIRQNQAFDSLLVKESERLVRSRAYIRDVSFFVKSASKKSDSVDIYIRSLDRWSITPGIEASSSRLGISLADNNFLGLGHKFKNGVAWYQVRHLYAFSTNYYIPNIRNTYVNSSLDYSIDEFGNYTKNIAIDRPFFSPFARWAAGINISQELRRDTILTSDSIYIHQRFKFNTQDFWAGHAIRIFKGSSENDRTTNFISAARFLRIRYLERPVENFDPQYKFSDENFYLASIGISTRKYVQDKFVFKYGITEDVPIGKVFSFTGGYQEKNGIGRVYIGARVSAGNYHPWGYLSTNFEYGTFLNAKHTEQGVFTAGINYYTGLFEVGKWKFRQFIKPQLTLGFNRFSNDSINLNEGYGLDGFNSNILSGTSRLLFTLQSQSYAPWNFIGFRFGPYFICSLGMLGHKVSGFENSKVYSQIGLGVLIKNENLVINTFQISIAFYPLTPADGQNAFKTNSIKTNDFGFRDFEIGKPAPVLFQ